eukprot:s1768_g8.t1
MGGEFRPQPFHVLAGPGLRTGERLAVEFDAAILDLVAPVSKIQAESVIEFELPSLFDQRPHEDSTVEAWLQKYLDSGGKDGEIVLEAKCCAKLQLAIDEQPEVCPVFRHLLSQFEVALVAWLEEWPPAEPRREGLCVSSEISPELLELQLHSVLALLGEGGLLAVLSENQAVVDSFRSVAIAWIFKLHSLYGLDILSQHERVTTKSASHLSMLSWDLFQVEELLQSPFFRPQELSLWRFAKRWCVEGTGAPAFAEESEDAESKVEVLPSPNKDEIDGAFSKVLLWDLLPPKDELVVQFAATQSAAAVEGDRMMSFAPTLVSTSHDPVMAGAQTSEVDAILKGFLTDYPTVIGFVVINSDGIPTKWHESMPYERAVIYAALMSDYIAHCKKCLKELLTGPAESELANVRLRTREGTEIIFVTLPEYTLAVIQNCTGKPWVQDEEAAAGGGGGGEGGA